MQIKIEATHQLAARRKRICAAKYLLVVACCWMLQGCLPLFVAAGAGAGYLAADKKAARKVDRFFQDLIKSSRTSSRRIAGVKKSGKHKQGAGPAVRLHESSLKPSTVAKGDSVTAVIIYGVAGSGAPEKDVTVVERKELWFNNKCVAVLQDESVSRENGTWKSRLVFKVPKSASKGTYTVKQVIGFNGQEKRSKKKFTVL